MKRFLIIIFLIIFKLQGFGQNFTTIHQGDSSLYTYNGNVYSPMSFPNSFRSIAVDSFRYINSDLVLYHFNTIRQDTSKNGSCTVKKLPNWTGKKTIIKNSGDNLFFTRSGDTILIKTLAKPNETWTYCKLSNGNYYEAIVSSKIKGPILGTSDSIKIITLNLKASDGSNLADMFNGKQILLSQSFGLVKAYDFFSFPSDTGSFVLTGTSKMMLGAQNASAKEIFDYSVGDEFQIKSADSYPSNDGQGTFTKEKREVLTKFITANGDTINYGIRRTIVQDVYDYTKNTSTHQKTIDTIEEKIIVSKFKILDNPPFKILTVQNDIYYNKINFLSTNYSTYNNRSIKLLPNYFGNISNDSCISYLLLSQYINYEYIKGLGGPYYNSDESVNQDHHELVYYKKGNETWGQQIDFTTGVFNAKSNSVQTTVFPNPATDNITISINNSLNNTGNYVIEIKDLLGNTIHAEQLSSNDKKLSLEGMNKGIYILMILDKNEVVGSEKLIIY